MIKNGTTKTSRKLSKNPQQQFLKRHSTAYGGDLLKTRKARSRGRPLSTKSTMHLVLRSTKATGARSFYRNRKPVIEILNKFAVKYGVKMVTFANAGNHLHLQIKLTNRYAYFKFIRAVTAAIAMKIGGANRWSKTRGEKFWDRRPFSRVVETFKAYLKLKDYIRINELEGYGYCRQGARFEVGMENIRRLKWSG